MTAVREKRPSVLRQSLSTLAMMIAVIALFCVGHASAAEYKVGDFTVTSSRGMSTTEYNVTKYSGHSADVTLPDPTVEYPKDPTSTDAGTFRISGFSDKLFAKNNAITSVTVPEGYTVIPSGGFLNCTGLESVSLPGSLTDIYANAFEGCSSLTSVTFAEGDADRLIFKNAVFINCTSLESIQLPARLSELANDANPFYGCSALTSITVAPGESGFFSDNGLLYRKEGSTGAVLTAFPFGKITPKLTLPAEAGGLPVVKIGGHMFRKNDTLTEVTIPASITDIGLYAFNGCSELTTVNLLTEEALTLGGSCFEDLAEGSTIYVASQTAAQSFVPVEDWDYPCYTEGLTTVSVKEHAPEPSPVQPVVPAAAISIRSAGISDGNAIFDIYMENSSCVSTVLLKLAFDSAEFAEGSAETAGGIFFNATLVPTDSGADLMLNQAGNTQGYTGAEPVKVATVTLPVQSGVTGELTAALTRAEISGITGTTSPSVRGEASISTSAASVYVAGYDVNGDRTVDQVDITEAQRYYQADRQSDNWETARIADVNNDGIVDLQDLVDLFLNLTDF